MNKINIKIDFFLKKNIKTNMRRSNSNRHIQRKLICVSSTKCGYCTQTFPDFEGWEILVMEHMKKCPGKDIYEKEREDKLKMMNIQTTSSSSKKDITSIGFIPCVNCNENILLNDSSIEKAIECHLKKCLKNHSYDAQHNIQNIDSKNRLIH